jgi:GDPmannose 4,6-dehydratase
MTKKALIIGSGGQDGVLLTQLLISQQYDVHGIRRNDVNILNPVEVAACLRDYSPTEVYYLAAFHHSSENLPPSNGELFRKSMDIHFYVPVNFLDAIAMHYPLTRFFFASSSHIFGSSGNGAHTETSAYAPQSEYAITKLAGMSACKYYRDSKNIFACTGILYNHESPLRKSSFLSKKIVTAVAEIHTNGVGSIEIADLEAEVDWGDARDTVRAIHKIMQLESPDDYIVSTGKLHTVRDFAETAFNYVGLNYADYVVESKRGGLRKPFRRLGNPGKLKNDSSWRPLINFETMVHDLVQYEINVIANQSA